jgi:hypothetical protein
MRNRGVRVRHLGFLFAVTILTDVGNEIYLRLSSDSRGRLADLPERMRYKLLSAALDASIDHPASPTLSTTYCAHRLEA